MTTPTSASVWRKYNTDGVPASGPHSPDKDEIIAWAGSLEGEIASALASVLAVPPPNPIFLLQNFR